MGQFTAQDFMIPVAPSLDGYQNAQLNELKLNQQYEQIPNDILKQKLESEVLPLSVIKQNIELAQQMAPINIDRVRSLSGANAGTDELKQLLDQEKLRVQFPELFMDKAPDFSVQKSPIQFQKFDPKKMQKVQSARIKIKNNQVPSEDEMGALNDYTEWSSKLLETPEPQEKLNLELNPGRTPQGMSLPLYQDRPAAQSPDSPAPEKLKLNLADPKSIVQLAAQTDPSTMMGEAERKLIPTMAAMENQRMLRAADLTARTANQRAELIMKNRDLLAKMWELRQKTTDANKKAALDMLLKSIYQFGETPDPSGPRSSGKSKKDPDLDAVVTRKFADANKDWDAATKGTTINTETLMTLRDQGKSNITEDKIKKVANAEGALWAGKLRTFKTVFGGLSPAEKEIALRKFPVQFMLLGIGQPAKPAAPGQPSPAPSPQEKGFFQKGLDRLRGKTSMMTEEVSNLQAGIQSPSAKRVAEVITRSDVTPSGLAGAISNLRKNGASEDDIAALQKLYVVKARQMALAQVD